MSAEETRKDNAASDEAAPELGPDQIVEGPEVGSAEAAVSDELSSEVARLNEEVAGLKEQALRTQAEMQNVRRRAELDVEKAHKFALEKFVRELLPVVDSLEKAVENSTAKEGSDELLISIREGVEMTLNMFISSLRKFNVEQINPLGAPFDPQQHEAMSMVPAPDAEPNSVVAVMQKGYLLNERLVRPAMVVVAKPQNSGAGQNVEEKA